MRAYTTNTSRSRAWLGVLALAVAVCLLLVASTAGAQYSSVNAITGGSEQSSQPAGSPDVGSGYSSLNSITGASSSEPVTVPSSPATDDGFDWLSAAIGAAAAMALAALAGAAFLTIRRRAAVSPSPASTS
jgi:hypothetical protein